MIKNRVCQYCKTLFEKIEGRTFSNHVRWCNKNTTNGDKGNASISKSLLRHFNDNLGKLTGFNVLCTRCKKTFIINERAKLFPQKEKYYCSRSCANTRDHTEKIKQRISASLIKALPQKECLFCTTIFQSNRKKQKLCSTRCSQKYRYKDINKETLGYYRKLCAFTFSIKKFPGEFDFKLIEKYGWYKASNHGNNLGGVSRDHMISVKYGYENKIEPKIISHPANCKLLIHNENVSKSQKCTMTLEELLEKIKIWDKKYDYSSLTNSTNTSP